MRLSLLFCLLFSSSFLCAQQTFTHADSLRGSWFEGRQKWKVLHYDIMLQPDIEQKTIEGYNRITYIDSGFSFLQIDLQQPLIVDSINYEGRNITFTHDGNVIYAYPRKEGEAKPVSPEKKSLTVYYRGTPKEAIRAPWDGGVIWSKDKAGNPFVSIACQGLGASVWLPCKDSQMDEPSEGATITIIVPDTLMAVSNGRKVAEGNLGSGSKYFTWEVKNPINSYNIIPYIGKYAHYSSVFNGEKGPLTMDYYPLLLNAEIAKKQIAQGDSMMKAFEHWFGPYPFYEDGYKLIEAPHLGMEHQSAVAYGNKYTMGYMGRDLSQTGEGLRFDFILVHESGHEWFGNNITTNDVADMWVHESFTNYSETLYLDYFFGKEVANKYVVGTRHLIKNDINVIGTYGVQQEGSGDMYYKGGNMIHFIRQVMNNDEKFREMLRGMNREFYHKTVSTVEVENFINKFSGINFTPMFDQYLRSVQIPKVEFKVKGKELQYRITNTVNGFVFPLRINTSDAAQPQITISPNSNWQKIKFKSKNIAPKVVDSYYVDSEILVD